MKCTVCNHPQLPAIDLALLAGGLTLESLHHQYGVSVSSLQRHKNHLQEKMRQARERLEDNRKQVSLLKLTAFLDHVQRGVEAAEAEGDINKVFKGCQIGSRLIKQINQMDVPLDLGAVYLLISSPGFASQDSLLPTSPQVIADLHRALVDSAFFPCPDAPPEISGVDEDDDEVEDAADANSSPVPLPGTGKGKPETAPALEAIRLLQQHFPDLDLSAADLPSAEKEPGNKWEISGKSAPKNNQYTDNCMQNHADNSCEKSLAQNPGVGRDPQGGESQSQAPPAAQASDAPLETQNSEPETTVPETRANPWLSLDLDPWLTPTPEPCLADPPPDSFETRNSELESAVPETEPQKPGSKPPPPYDETARRADELFEISHGYKRNNPPKHIPNRRREEDFRSTSIFGDPKKIYG